jgi:hypothetical protein
MRIIKKQEKMKNYTGKDLGENFREFFKSEKKRITKDLKELGCTNVQMSCQFYYFYGFFTSSTGQPYYFSCSDVRYWGYERLLYRIAKSYIDYTGGMNQYIKVHELKNLNLI